MNSNNKKASIVIDLDDTLVHVTPIAPINLDIENSFTIIIKKRKFFVQKRPHLNYFLEKIDKLYDVYIFTASKKEYANKIIDKIIPSCKESCRFFKDSCIKVSGYFVKDLKIINRPIKQMLLIDDSAGSALNNPKNLIKIKPWSGEKEDNVLIDLITILEKIAFDNDVVGSFIEIMKSRNFDGIDTF